MLELSKSHTVKWVWVRGHNGHPENERCDELALRLAEWQWPDGGWNCDKRPEVVISSFMETLIPRFGSGGEDMDVMVQELIRHPERYTTNVHENRRSDGTLVWMNWANRAILDGQGHLQEILSIGNDISRLKETEHSLVGARRTMHEVLESVEDALYGLDRDWCFIYVNPKAEQLLRRTQAELFGKRLWDEFPQVRGTESEGRLRYVMEHRTPVRFETRSSDSLP